MLTPKVQGSLGEASGVPMVAGGHCPAAGAGHVEIRVFSKTLTRAAKPVLRRAGSRASVPFSVGVGVSPMQRGGSLCPSGPWRDAGQEESSGVHEAQSPGSSFAKSPTGSPGVINDTQPEEEGSLKSIPRSPQGPLPSHGHGHGWSRCWS